MGGVPLVVVGAVEDSDVILALIVQVGSQSLSTDGGAGLAGVGGADRVDHIGVVDAALEQVDPPVVFEFIGGEVTPLQAQVVVIGGVIHPLVGDVVEGEQAGGACPTRDRSSARS